MIATNDKQVQNYAACACISCERLLRRDQCTVVNFDDSDGNPCNNRIWLAIKAFAIMSNPDVDSDKVIYFCKHCKAKIKKQEMPDRCVLNGLETVLLPKELKGLDPFSLQLVQLAKPFQTVVRLNTYSNKVPNYNSLKACKGNMFFLPLPLNKTASTLELTECGLPKPQLFVKIDSAPTKANVIWRKLIDINMVQCALTKLKEINWLYGKVKPDKVDESIDHLVLEVANSATCTMTNKINDQSEYTAGLQAYTLHSMDNSMPAITDIDQYKMMHVEDYPLRSDQ